MRLGKSHVMQFSAAPRVPVQITLSGPGGDPLRYVDLEARRVGSRSGQSWRALGRTNKRGALQTNLPVGEYELLTSPTKYLDALHAFSVEHEKAEVVIVLQEKTIFTARVVFFRDGQPEHVPIDFINSISAEPLDEEATGVFASRVPEGSNPGALRVDSATSVVCGFTQPGVYRLLIPRFPGINVPSEIDIEVRASVIADLVLEL